MGNLYTGAEIVFKCLEDQKVDHIFGYPGGAVLPIYDELKNHPSIKHILVRHEQGAGHAAEGYARSSGKPGVVLVTSGPGATNVVTALTDAYMDSVPLVCISGQVPTHLIGTDAFQECDTTGITRPCTKHNWLVKDINDLPKDTKLKHKRIKPWGTAHAVWSARNVIKSSFVIINADDYYGKEAFEQAANYMKSINYDKSYGLVTYKSVSYTHLTLPTSDLV